MCVCVCVCVYALCVCVCVYALCVCVCVCTCVYVCVCVLCVCLVHLTHPWCPEPAPHSVLESSCNCSSPVWTWSAHTHTQCQREDSKTLLATMRSQAMQQARRVVLPLLSNQATPSDERCSCTKLYIKLVQLHLRTNETSGAV